MTTTERKRIRVAILCGNDGQPRYIGECGFFAMRTAKEVSDFFEGHEDGRITLGYLEFTPLPAIPHPTAKRHPGRFKGETLTEYRERIYQEAASK